MAPQPLRRQRPEDVAAQGGAAAGPGHPDSHRRDVDAERGDAVRRRAGPPAGRVRSRGRRPGRRTGRARDGRPGRRPRASAARRGAGRRRSRGPGAPGGRPAARLEDVLLDEHLRHGTAPTGPRRGPRTAPARGGRTGSAERARRPRRASSGSSTSRSGGSAPRPEPGGDAAGPTAGAGDRGRHRDARAAPAGVAPRVPQPERPPAAVGGRAEPGVDPGLGEVGREQGGGHLRGVHADEQRGAGVGASAAAIRSPWVRPCCGTTANPAGSGARRRRRARAPAAGRGRGRDGVEGVGERRRRERRGPRRGRTAGASRVLLRPGYRGLREHEDRQAARPGHPGAGSTRRMSATAATVPRTVPVTFERPVRGW